MIELLTASIVVVVFTVAFASKIIRPAVLVDYLEALGFRSPRAGAVVLLTSEAVLLAAFVIGLRAGLASALGWLVIATATLFATRSRGVGCNCFGESTTNPEVAILRNAALIGVTLIGLTVGNVNAPSFDSSTAIAVVIVGAVVLTSASQVGQLTKATP